MNDFANALMLCDEVIVADIYAAREANTYGVSSEDLSRRINQIGGSAQFLPDFEKIKNYVTKNLLPGDVLITMGAGNVTELADLLTADQLST